MAKHPPGMAVKHYRILGIVHFDSSSMVLEQREMLRYWAALQCPHLVCPSFWLTLNLAAYTVCALSQSPGNCSAA